MDPSKIFHSIIAKYKTLAGSQVFDFCMHLYISSASDEMITFSDTLFHALEERFDSFDPATVGDEISKIVKELELDERYDFVGICYLQILELEMEYNQRLSNLKALLDHYAWDKGSIVYLDKRLSFIVGTEKENFFSTEYLEVEEGLKECFHSELHTALKEVELAIQRMPRL